MQFRNSVLYLFLFFIFILPLWAFQNQLSNNDKSIKDIDWYLEKKNELYNANQYEAAIQLLDEAQKNFQQNQQWQKYVICGIEKSKLADNTSDEEKKQYAFETLTIVEKYLSRQDTLSGQTYQQVAETYMLYEQNDSALFFIEKAITILETHKKWQDLAWAVISKGINHFYLGNNDAFKASMDKSEELYREHNLLKATFINILELRGAVYSIEGNHEMGLKNMNEVIQFYSQIPNPTRTDSFIIATNYQNISEALIGKGAYSKAIDYQKKAQQLYQLIEEKKEYAYSFIGLSQAYWSQLDFEKTIQLCKQGLDLSTSLTEEDKQFVSAKAYIMLGKAYSEIEQYDSSAFYLNLAKNVDSKRTKGMAWVDYGILLQRQGKPKETIKALETAKTYYSNLEEYQSTLHMGLGYAYANLNDFENAMKNLQKALSIHAINFKDTSDFYVNPQLIAIDHPVFFLQSLEAKAYCLSQFKDNPKNLEAALTTHELTLDWLDTMRQSYSFDDSKVVVNTRNRRKYERAIQLAYELYENSNDEKYLNKAFSFAERMKSNVLLASIQTNDNQTIIPKELKEREKELSASVAFYERELQNAKNQKNEEATKIYQQNLTDYRVALATSKGTLQRDYAKYYDLKYQTVLASISTIQADLDDNQGFISYYTGDSGTYAFMITKDKVDFNRLENTTQLNEEITAFRQLLDASNAATTKEGFAQYNQSAHQLYQKVLATSLSDVSDNINKLTIIPDGSLNYIPFEVLTTGVADASQDFSKMPYLIKDYQINYGYSATLLRENAKRQSELSTNANCLAYAPPYQEETPIAERQGSLRALRSAPTALQGTGKEIQAIAKYFGGQFDQSETATKANFIQKAPDFGMLHLAMHGEPNFENEKMANLKFINKAGQSKDDYLLYQSDIVNMDLNAQLVVLSACETGLGKYVYGEGIASLGRSFMYAGVPSVMMSLWKVDDKATSQLMPYFYENLANGMKKDKALHQAKLTFLEKEDFGNLHPHFWAGFVTIGDVQPIQQPSTWWYWLLGSFVLVGLGFVYRKRILKK